MLDLSSFGGGASRRGFPDKRVLYVSGYRKALTPHRLPSICFNHGFLKLDSP